MSAKNLSTPSKPPQTMPPTSLPPSRMVSWLITSVIIGWAIAYNVLRIAGRSPHDAALPSFLIGLGIGALLFVGALAIWRRIVNGPRYRAGHMNEIPPPERLDTTQRSSLDLLWPAVAILAVLIAVTGFVMIQTWFGSEGDRSVVRVVIGGWDLLVGVWLAFEAFSLRNHDGEAVESIGTSALLTAVLGGVALSMDQIPALQGAVIVTATIVSLLAYQAGWRLLGSRGIPFASIGAAIVGLLSLIVPLLTR